MFKVLSVDGPNIMTDKGGIQLVPFQYADGGATRPVGPDDWLAMRDGFVALPDLLAACKEVQDGLASQWQNLTTGEWEEPLAGDLYAVLEGVIARAGGKAS